MTGKAKYFEDFVQKASSWLNWVTIAAFVVMAIITTADVVGAKLLGKPILVSFDIVSYAGLLAVVPAIAWIQSNHGHIEVELLTKRMSLHAQNVLACIMNILGIVLFIVMTWQMMDYGLTLQRTNRVSSIAELPMAPFAYFTVLCFIMVIAVLVAQTLVLLNKEVNK